MTIVFVSNFFNEHVLPICNEFASAVESFYFISLTEVSEERKAIGFTDISDKYDYVMKAYNCASDMNKAYELIKSADIVFFLEVPNKIIKIRMNINKLTFLCSERFYKYGMWRLLVPKSYKKKKGRFLNYRNKQLYLLTIGAYLPYELNLLRFPLEKCYTWGYFPLISANKKSSVIHKKLSLIWVGRMIYQKHPEEAVKIAKKLKEKNIEFSMKMIGDGPYLKKVKRLITKYDLSHEIILLGKQNPKNTQILMSESDSLLFTSDFWEGWGAVLYEAMSLGCVPVAKFSAGATHILISNEKNGYIYHNIKDAVLKIQLLSEKKELIREMSEEASSTVNKLWSPQNAVSRLLCVSNRIINSEDNIKYESGPMSPVKLYRATNYIYTNF